MAPPAGFSWKQRKNGTVVILHNGAVATTLRGRKAEDFLAEAEVSDDQELMARVTGNYKRGNERQARSHPRNQRRS